MYLTNYVNSF